MRRVLKFALIPAVLVGAAMIGSPTEAKAGWGVSLGVAPGYGAYAPGYGGYYGAPYAGYYAPAPVVTAPVTPYYAAPAPVYRSYVAPVAPLGIGLNFYGGGGYPGYGHHHHHGYRW
jgi:hypothetical protein